MDNWSKLSAGLSSLNIGSNAGKLAKGFTSSVQATRERLGQVAVEDITELPQEYKELETRVDALKVAHEQMLRITSVYATAYDYPNQIGESITEFSSTLSQGFVSFAAANLKGTKLPSPSPGTPAPALPKTLPHAIGRAATNAATALGPNERLGKGLSLYAGAFQKIGDARLNEDDTILENFVAPWQSTLTNSINIAMKSRQAVKTSRLELDAAKQTLKSSTGARQEQARLDVENAEDDLVQKTEIAIGMMKAVLENPESLKNLNELVKSQLVFHTIAAEALQTAQTEIEELSIAAEGDYRKSRDQ